MGGNWKLNPTTIEASLALSKGLAELTKDVTDVDVLIFPPTTVLYPVQLSLANSAVKVISLSNIITTFSDFNLHYRSFPIT
jgi:triosephosphate isomerase